MKKKLLVATALILLIAVGLTMFAGCDEIFKRNDKRDNTQIVATVTYQGDFQPQTAYVYKFELASSFSSYANVYHTYYGMSYEEVADYVLRSLAQQKLLVLFAKDKLTGLANLTEIPSTEALLSLAERNKAIENANESLLSSLRTLVERSVTDDMYNNGTVTEPVEDEEPDDEELGDDTVIVRFNSVGGSDVEKVRINKGSKVAEPDEPTRDGYTFYGWYKVQLDDNGVAEKDGDGNYIYLEEFDFEEEQVNAGLTLYAKWAKYTAPRTEIPVVEEDEDKDYDPDVNEGIELSAKFFTDDYKATILDEFKEEDFVENIKVPDGSTVEVELQKYIDEQLEQLERNLKSNLYKDSVEECYDYYLSNQYESLLITRLERKLGEDLTVTEDEINAEFNRVADQNKWAFRDSDTAYSSALTSSLNSTYYHPGMADGDSYGFVINILLRLSDESLKKLTDFYGDNHQDSKELVTIRRNKLLSEIEVNISNPAYKSTEVVEQNGEEIELRDPMTDPKNPYNNVGKDGGEYDHSFQYNVSAEGADPVYQNDYNKILTFEYDAETKTGKLVSHISEHPAMAYMLESWPAFDQPGKTGVIHQIYNSFDSVNQLVESGELTPIEGAYWLRELATRWAYLVGDDSGAVTSSSNNNGLGYLITPEGEDSTYLKDFTTYARALVKKGTGSYCDETKGEITDDDFLGADAKGEFKGNNRVFVAADSFIESGNTSNAYAGIFVLLNSYTVWDDVFYNKYITAYNADKEDGEKAEEHLNADDGYLSLDYVVSFAEKDEDKQSIRDIIKDKILEAKKSDVYSFVVNEMGTKEVNNIKYNKKAYKSLWKDLSD